jgi:hypothetical protein
LISIIIDIYHKGLDVLLDAWQQLCHQYPGLDLRLLLVGTGSDAEELRQRIAAMQPRGVLWVDKYVIDRAAMRCYLSAADVHVLASRHEGFSVAPLEAMACGLPVVAADAPGVPDILEGGECSGGLVVPRGDAAALALALGRALDNEAWRRELGRRARKRVEDYFRSKRSASNCVRSSWPTERWSPCRHARNSDQQHDAEFYRVCPPPGCIPRQHLSSLIVLLSLTLYVQPLLVRSLSDHPVHGPVLSKPLRRLTDPDIKSQSFAPRKKAFDQAGFSPDPFHGVAQFHPKMRDIEAADIAQLDPFELLPKAFTRIQLRGIGWQPLQVQPLCHAMHQELLNAMTAVNRGAIPDNDYPARHFTQQVFQEGDHIHRVASQGAAGRV